MATKAALVLAQDGADLVRRLTDAAGAASDVALRIAIDPQHQSLSMSLDGVKRDDRVVAAHGAQVFMSEAAATRLEGCTLRAESGSLRSSFYLVRAGTSSSRRPR